MAGGYGGMVDRSRNDTMMDAGRILAMVFIVLLAAVSCGRTGDRHTMELRVGLEDQPKTLDPRYATDAYGTRISHHLLFSTLVEEGYDLQTVPGLAERWETPDDTTYVFHLRPDVFFHDGERLSARDVKFTFEHVMDPETGSPFGPNMRNIIRSIEVPDERTVRFTLTRPSASFLSSVVIPILPGHAAEQLKEPAGFLTGSGPFKFVSQNSSEIVLASNERYFGGRPKIDRLVFKVITDDNTRFLKMKKGDLDLLINAIPLDKIDEVGKPPLNAVYDVIEEPGISYNYLAFNLEKPVLRDPRVRQAIALGVNVDEIIEHRLNGHAIRATGMLSPVNRFYSGDVTVFPHDPERAKALLKEAGFPAPGREDSYSRINLELKTSNNAQVVGIARILQAQLAEIGIHLDVRSYEWGTFYGDIKSGNFELTTLRWVGIVDPDFYFDVFHSSQAPPVGNNRGRYANADLDRLLDAGRVTLDFEARKAVYGEVQKKLADDLPYVSLWHANNVSIVHRRVKGYRQHPTGGFLSFRDISLDEPAGESK